MLLSPPNMGKYRDFDALAYEPKIQGDDDHIAMNHVTKRHKKDKGIEVVFDPAHHKYVTSHPEGREGPIMARGPGISTLINHHAIMHSVSRVIIVLANMETQGIHHWV